MVAAAIIIAQGASALADDPVRIGPNLDRPHGLSVSANGQTVVTIAGRDHAILAGEPTKDGPWRELVAGAGEDLPRPVAVGFLPGDVVAAVCRDGDAWTVRTFRIRPESAADPATPLQSVRLGTASGEASDVALAVHHARGWLVVTGLPSPLPPVIRCAIAGVRLGPPSDRSCPSLPDQHRPVAVGISPAGDILLVLRRDAGDDVLGVYDAAGRELLRVPAGLQRVAAISVGRGDDSLWATGVSADGKTGLWRLDAAFHDRRQVVQPVFTHPLASPAAMVSVSDRVIVGIDRTPQPTVLRICPPILAPSNTGRIPP
jgi:hypothetical protein